jgi:hypothetical protein
LAQQDTRLHDRRGDKVMSGFFASSNTPVELDVAPVKIHDAPRTRSLPVASPGTSTDVIHRFGNTALNARIGGVVAHSTPQSAYKVNWQMNLEPGLNPVAVLNAGDRFLVWGWGGWQLLDQQGRTLTSGLLDSADVLLDAPRGLFFLVDATGKFSARHLKDGALAFELEAPSPRKFQVSYLGISGEHLIATAIAQPPPPHASFKPHTSLLQTHRLTGSAALLEHELTRDEAELRTALSGDTLVIAATNRIYLAGPDLNLHASMQGDFEPLVMSLDESGHIYMVVRDAQGLAIWVLTPDGQREVSLRLPANRRTATVPPMIAYDHRVYILSSGLLACISPEGRMSWHQTVSEAAQGSILADNALLLSNGSELLRVTPEGKRSVLFQFDEWLRAPAIVTSRGEVIAVTEHRVYCLSPG